MKKEKGSEEEKGMKEEKRLEKGGNGLERRRRAGMGENGGNWEKN